MPTLRQRYNDLLSQRAQHLTAAQTALDGGNQSDYQAAMAKATEMNGQIDDVKALLDEQDRYARLHAPSFGTGDRDMKEMGRMLAAGEAVKFNAAEVMMNAGLGRTNSTTLATGTLVQPQGAGANIRDGFATQVSSLIDQVQTINLTGLNAYEEPYVVSELEAKGGKVTTNAGTARAASDPTFAKAKIAPYELNVTSFVDRNLSRLNPVDYAAKIQSMALRALRRKANSLVLLGDGQPSPDMFGITTAKNTAGTAIYSAKALGSAITVDTLDTLIYAYGGDEMLGGNARLLLTKANLQKIGALRGTNEKRRLFGIRPDAGNPNTGTIEDGGTIIPYTIVTDLGDSALAYGDPYNYELALFGDYVIRVDESVKAVERMNAILGDIMIGGNLVVHHGFVVGSLSSGA